MKRPPVHVSLALVTLALALVALTILVIAEAIPPAVVNDRFDVAITTASLLVAGAAAAVDWARGRLAHEPAAYLRASAFTVLALVNAIILVSASVGADADLGGTLEDPGQLPLLAGVASRGIAGVMLVLAGWAVVSRRVPAFNPLAALFIPAGLLLGILVVGALAQDSLPVLAPSSVIEALRSDPTAPLPLGWAPALLIMQGVAGAAFLAAAGLAYRAYGRSMRTADALLAAGLLVAAFSQLHNAVHPGSYVGLVSTGDVLRLVFYVLLLVGVVADTRQDLAELRAAHGKVRRLLADQFAAAGAEERARLAREIHDGLAQDLWYAKLKQSRLAQLAAFEGEAQKLSDEVGDAIDAALAEARSAVAAMREGSEAGPLLDMLSHHLDDFSDRFALRAELTSDGPPPKLGARAKAEILRIVQEALTNVRKHADATVVRVAVANDRGLLRLSVSDNGKGFRPEAVPGGFGLDSMRQRAAIIGGTLEVTAEPLGGARIELAVPTESGGAADGS